MNIAYWEENVSDPSAFHRFLFFLLLFMATKRNIIIEHDRHDST